MVANYLTNHPLAQPPRYIASNVAVISQLFSHVRKLCVLPKEQHFNSAPQFVLLLRDVRGALGREIIHMPSVVVTYANSIPSILSCPLQPFTLPMP